MAAQIPVAAAELIGLAYDGQWSFLLQHNVDSGGAPYVNFKAKRGLTESVEVSWHTRQTGTYRLFDCASGINRGRHTISLTKARELLAAEQVSP